MLKRLISFVLCALLVFQIPVTAYAESPASGGGGGPVPTYTGGGSQGTRGITAAYGYRITLTSAAPISESNIQALDESNYTDAELEQQRTDIGNIAKTRYWEPENYGLNFVHPGSLSLSEIYVVASSKTGQYNINPRRAREIKGSAIGLGASILNRLAWMLYDTGDNATTRPDTAAYAFNEEIYNKVQGNASAATDALTWVADIRNSYNATGNDVTAVVEQIMGDSNDINNNMRWFTWASTNFSGTPQQRVKWSGIGLLSACMYLTWYAQDIGDNETAQIFANALWNWKTSGWTKENMPIILIEATQAITYTGDVGGANDKWVMATVPYTLRLAYGQDVVERLFMKWEASTLDEEIRLLTTDRGLDNKSRIIQVSQGFNKYWQFGQMKAPYGSGAGRDRFHTLWPIAEDSQSWYGYGHHYTFYADNFWNEIPGGGRDPAKGTFTWDLTPKGIIDKTPSEEVNESSTIYNLNVSQNGHNSNNYAEWEKWVLSDGKDCNKIRFNIYHVSEALNKDVPATDYTYGQVKATGKKVTEAVDRVTVGSGQIGNVPSIGYEVVNILQI